MYYIKLKPSVCIQVNVAELNMTFYLSPLTIIRAQIVIVTAAYRGV